MTSQNQWRLPDVSPLCLHRLSSPLFSILPQSRSTKGSWLLGEIQSWSSNGLPRAFGCFSPLAFPLSLSTVEIQERGENVKVVTPVIMHFPAESNNKWCETSCIKGHFPWHDVCVFQILHRLHHVSCLLPGVGQRCEVRSCHVVPRTVQRSPEGV